MVTRKFYVKARRGSGLFPALKKLEFRCGVDMDAEIDRTLLTEMVYGTVKGEAENVQKFVDAVLDMAEDDRQLSYG